MAAHHRHAAAIDRRGLQEAFRKYQQIPQYEYLNKGMSLDAFKAIFWWEWTHRNLGRLIGIAFLLPFLCFLTAGYLSRRLGLTLAGIFCARRPAGRPRLVHGELGVERTR
jgi:hypothetical protein